MSPMVKDGSVTTRALEGWSLVTKIIIKAAERKNCDNEINNIMCTQHNAAIVDGFCSITQYGRDCLSI